MWKIKTSEIILSSYIGVVWWLLCFSHIFTSGVVGTSLASSAELSLQNRPFCKYKVPSGEKCSNSIQLLKLAKPAQTLCVCKITDMYSSWRSLCEVLACCPWGRPEVEMAEGQRSFLCCRIYGKSVAESERDPLSQLPSLPIWPCHSWWERN